MAKLNLKVSGVYLLGQLFDDMGPVPNSRYFPCVIMNLLTSAQN